MLSKQYLAGFIDGEGYLSGPYSGTEEKINNNIKKARELAIKVWESGFACLCPHLNTANFEIDSFAYYEDGDGIYEYNYSDIIFINVITKNKLLKREVVLE